jgi:hypothetical protein
MCILKALDQETVDLKKNRDLQSQIYLTEKSQRKVSLMSNLIKAQNQGVLSEDKSSIGTPGQAAASGVHTSVQNSLDGIKQQDT